MAQGGDSSLREDWWKNPEREQETRKDRHGTWAAAAAAGGGGLHSCKWCKQKGEAEAVTQRGRAQECSPVSSLACERASSHTQLCPLLNPQSASQAQEHGSPDHLSTAIHFLYFLVSSCKEAQTTSFARSGYLFWALLGARGGKVREWQLR